MKFWLRTLFVALCILILPITAFANLEIKSENIIFYGDVKAEDGERLVRNLETYRAVILAMTNIKNRPDATPLKIYAFKNEKTLSKFADRRGIAGIYTQGADGPVFLTVSKGGFKDDKWSSQVALHEYSHHVLHALSRDNYPRWYDEGFANYLSTFNIKKDIVTIGAPKANHGASLKDLPWMDATKVLSAIRRYPRTRRMDKFYGQSWLYVHYMQNTPELSKKLPTYLEALKTQKDPLKAFENSFGISIDEFHKSARLYWNKNAFPVASFKASPKLLEHEIVIRDLTDEEMELSFARVKLNFIDKKSAVKLDKKLENLESSLGQLPDLLLIRAESAMISEDYEKAANYISQAIKTSEINSRLLRLRGDIAYHKLWSEQFGKLADNQAKVFQKNKDLYTAIKYFEDALLLDSANATTNLHLLSLLGRSDAQVSSAGFKAVERSYELLLKPDDVGEYISVANIMARTGKMQRACDNYRYIKGRIEDYKDKSVNDDFARLMKFEQDYPVVCQ